MVSVQVDCDVGRPKVNYRETIQRRAEFDYLHKKQSGGSGAQHKAHYLCFVCTQLQPLQLQSKA